jgi:hypothetical protein
LVGEKLPGVDWAHLDIIAGQFGEPNAGHRAGGTFVPRYPMSIRSRIVTRELLLKEYICCMVSHVGHSGVFGRKGYGRCDWIAEVREVGTPVHKAKARLDASAEWAG